MIMFISMKILLNGPETGNGIKFLMIQTIPGMHILLQYSVNLCVYFITIDKKCYMRQDDLDSLSFLVKARLWVITYGCPFL